MKNEIKDAEIIKEENEDSHLKRGVDFRLELALFLILGFLLGVVIKTEAVKRVFDGFTKKICMSSIKSMLGHTMGAASAIEAISCCLAIEKGVIPPTINYETPDPDCDLDCVPNKAKRKDVRVAINNSMAFGGNNACLVLSNIAEGVQN